MTEPEIRIIEVGTQGPPGGGIARARGRDGVVRNYSAQGSIPFSGLKVTEDGVSAARVLVTEFPDVDPTGATDSTSGIQDGDAATAGDPLGFPAGTYLVDDISLSAALDMFGGVIKPAADKVVTHLGPIAAGASLQLWDLSLGGHVDLAPIAIRALTPYHFGAKGDATGVPGEGTDDSDAIVAMIETALRSGVTGGQLGGFCHTRMELAGHFRITKQIRIDRLRGAEFVGHGVWTSRFYWDGAAPDVDAALLFYNCRECIVGKFLLLNVANPPTAQIECRGDTADPDLGGYPPTSMTWENLWIQGGGSGTDTALNSDYGLLYTYAAVNAANDLGKFKRVFCSQQNIANFSFGKDNAGTAGSNMKGFQFDDCRGGFARYGIVLWGGSFHAHGGYWFGHRTRALTDLTAPASSDVLAVTSTELFVAGHRVAVDKPGATRQISTIVTVDSPTQLTVADVITADAGSVVMQEEEYECADFARSSSNHAAADTISIDRIQSEQSNQLFVDCFDNQTANNLQVPVTIRHCRFSTGMVALGDTDLGIYGYAVTLRAGGANIDNCSFGGFNETPGTIRIAAAVSYVGRYKVAECRWGGSPLAGGGVNPTNTPHIYATGKALVEDYGHTFYNGTIPQSSEDFPAYPDKVADLAALRAIPDYKRIDGKRVSVTALGGRAFAYDSTSGADRHDDNRTAARASDIAGTASGLWYEASDRVLVPDLDHLWLVNTDRFSLVELSCGTENRDKIGGLFGYDPNSSADDDDWNIIAPVLSDTTANLLSTAENDLGVQQFSAGGCSVASGTTLTDDTSGGPHVLSTQLNGLDVSGTVETDIAFDVKHLGGPITKLTFALANPGSSYNFQFNTATGLAAGAGRVPEVTTTSDGWFRIRIRLTSEMLGNRLQWYLAGAGGSVIYTGDGTGSLEIRRRIVRQRRTSSGRFVRQGVTGAIGAPLGDVDESIAVGGGAVRTERRATRTANRTDTLDTTGATAASVLDLTYLDGSTFTRAIVNGGPAGGTLLTVPAGTPTRIVATFDGTNWSAKSWVI